MQILGFLGHKFIVLSLKILLCLNSNWENTICNRKCSKKQYDVNKDAISLIILCRGYSRSMFLKISFVNSQEDVGWNAILST